MAQKVSKDEEEISHDPEGDELPPPPYWMMIPPASITAATGGPTGGTSPRPVSLPDSSKVPTAPQVVEPPSQQALQPSAGGTVGPPDSTTPDAATAFPKLPLSTPGQGGGTTGIKQRLHSAKEPEEKIPLQMPLREVQQPPMIREDGNYHQAPAAYYYQPFSSTDILNWQKHTPSYPVEPQGMTGLMETIFMHSSTNLGRYNAITSIPLSTEERYRNEVRKWLQEMVPWGTANPERWIEQAFPTDRPNWDYNTEERKIQLGRYKTAIIQRIKRGAQRPMDVSKLAGILQKGNESPSEFYERLCEAY